MPRTAVRSQTKASRSKTAEKKIPQNIRDKALSSFQKLRRMEEANVDGYVECISCGKVMHWKEAQGGHYIPRANRATEMEHDNVWPQCQRCNGFLNGNPIQYRIRLVRKIGEKRVSRIENLAMANKGDDDALASLSTEDKMNAVSLKSKKYYLARKKEFDSRIREIESGGIV